MARHLFVCTNARASGKPACGPRGGDALLRAIGRLLVERGVVDARVTPCGCLGACFDGPAAVLYPEEAWLGGLSPGDAAAVVDQLCGGAPLAARALPRPGADALAPEPPDAPAPEPPDAPGPGRRQ